MSSRGHREIQKRNGNIVFKNISFIQFPGEKKKSNRIADQPL